MNGRRVWLILLVVPPLLWAGNALVGRAVVGLIDPIELSFWRWLVALGVLLPFTARNLVAHRRILLDNWPVVAVMGLCSVAAYNTLLYMAMHTTTAINATLMGASMPLMILLLGRVWLGEAIRPAQAFGIVVSACGMLAVVTRGEPGRLVGLQLTPGDGLMVVATVAWAVYSVMLRRFPLAVPGATLLAALIVVGLAALAPLYAWHMAHAPVMAAGPAQLGAVLYTGLFASLVAFYFWNRGVAAVGAATAGQYSYLIPLFTALLAIPLLDERFHWYHALGGGLIFVGIFFATRRRPAPG
ncbi:MAG TPA: DMT family transporter [Magnetospirillum sp.]|nr:DMT family transporter [Magnetospirillum sp.]